MYRYQRLMVGMDFTFIDKVVVRYVSFLSRQIRPEKIYFINFQKMLDVPEGIREKFPALNQPLDEKFREQMMEEVKANFPDYKKYDIEYEIREGVAIEEMLHWSHIKNIDLVVTGRKSIHHGSGDLARRMTRKGMCSVLFVPQTTKASLDNILVAVDFSDNSQMAMEEAWSLAEKNRKARIICHHVYHLPIGYYSTGKSQAEFAQIMREHAEEKFKEFIGKLKIDAARITPLFELQTDLSVAAMIGRAAHGHHADLVLAGARGRTNATAILLGSVTEKLITECEDIPLLVVKKKDKSFSFYDFIRSV